MQYKGTGQNTRIKDLIQLRTKLRVIWHKKQELSVKQYGKIRNLVRKDCSVYNPGGDPQNKISKNVECSFKSYLKEC